MEGLSEYLSTMKIALIQRGVSWPAKQVMKGFSYGTYRSRNIG